MYFFSAAKGNCYLSVTPAKCSAARCNSGFAYNASTQLCEGNR